MKKLFALALLFLLSAPMVPQAEGVGGLKDDVFSNAELGFRYPLPKGLTDETSFARESLKERAAALHSSDMFDVLLRMTSGPDDSVPDWRAISIQSYSRSKFPDPDEEAVEARMNAFAAGTQALAVGSPKRVSIAGANFVVTNFEQSEPPLLRHARVCSTTRNGKVLSIALTANSPDKLEALANSLQMLEFTGASANTNTNTNTSANTNTNISTSTSTNTNTNASSGPYLGFDRNEYPGDENLKDLHAAFSYSGYWLNNPPGASSNTWVGKRDKLEAAGFGFLVLFNGRLYRELGSVERAAELGKADARAAVQAAGREGFPAQTVIFLDQEEGGRLLPEQKAYLFAWVDGVRQSGFRAGVYCSAIASKEKSGAVVMTATDLRQNANGRDITYWVTNDACPPSPGCAVARRPPSPSESGVQFADIWQFAQSPLRTHVAGGCVSSYPADGNCYAPGAGSGQPLHVDLNTANSADPSHGRTR